MCSRCRWFSAPLMEGIVSRWERTRRTGGAAGPKTTRRDVCKPPFDLPLLVFPTKPARLRAAVHAGPLISAPSGRRGGSRGCDRPLRGCGAETCRLLAAGAAVGPVGHQAAPDPVRLKVTLVRIPAQIAAKRAASFWRPQLHLMELITATFDCSSVISVSLCFTDSHGF